MTRRLEMPPETMTREGTPRHVGVEIEFAGVEVDAAAGLVRELYGGAIEQHDDYRFLVRATRFGDFTVELDSLYAHPDDADGKLGTLKGELKGKVASAIGAVVGLWMPNEIVAPPIRIDQLPELDRLIGLLRAQHAAGTHASVVYGFGLQLNPEVAARDRDYILRHLQAYLIMSPWLRDRIDVDATRRLLPFTDPFPDEYLRLVLDAEYAPTLERLIADYIDANPSRNRELDLMPLFMEVAPAAVRDRVDDPHIKARPTFHYRLPDARVDEEAWGGVVEEWNRWVEVERLAADPGRLAEARRAVHARLSHELGQGWLDWLKGWL